MKLLVIDLGSYSVKFTEYKTDKKSLHIESCNEVIIGQLKDQFHPDTGILDIQLEIVEGYINHEHYDGKLIYQIPQSFLTTRFVQVPVSNRKKAEMMIPFQLEENIPFQLHKCHFISELFKVNATTEAVVHISNLDEFEDLYHQLGEREILPALLSPEASFMQNYITQNNIQNDICILDIGHSSSNAYYFRDGKLSSTHTSHVAGKNITDVITQTYQIPTSEATIYKHENCFFLTENQYKEVDEDQREFANVMKQAVWPLVQDIKRWDLGYRVNYGKSVDKVYIMGGTAKIKNFVNFLSQAIKIEVEVFNLDHMLVINDEKNKLVESNPQFSLSNIMAASQLSKKQPANFLTAQYSSGFTENIPLHSTGFIAVRVAFFSLILILGLFIENILLKSRNTKITKTIDTIIKRSSNLKFTKKQIRELKKNKTLKKTVKLLSKRNKYIEQQLKYIQSATQTNALLALTHISRVAPNNENVDLIKFESGEGIVTAIFSSEELSELEKLKEVLHQSTLEEKEITLSQKQNILEITFKGN